MIDATTPGELEALTRSASAGAWFSGRLAGLLQPPLPELERDVGKWNAAWPARAGKRALDLGLAALLLVLLLPVLLVVAAVVRLDSPGPALLVQRRVGRRGRVFPMLKFRSMRLDAESDGPHFAVTDDPRCTRVGRLLRRSNMDELPQLVNVLLGQMSLVGPRPERPEFVAQLRQVIPLYDRRHAVRPGITGWAQVHGLRGPPWTIPARVAHDLRYIERWTLALDLRILALTALDALRPAAGRRRRQSR